MRLLLELYCVVLIKHVAFFTIWAKLTVAFTCTSFPLNLCTSVFGCGCGFGFEQNFWRIDKFGEKEGRIGGFALIPLFTALVKEENINTDCKLNGELEKFRVNFSARCAVQWYVRLG